MNYKKHVILQNDSNDCGAAALAMVMSYHKKKMPISRVREQIKTDKNGTSVYGLVEGAKKLGLSGSGFKGDQHTLTKKLPFPAILHTVAGEELNRFHYITIFEVKNNVATIGDPAVGLKKIPLNKLLEIWTGIIILLSPTVEFVKDDTTRSSLSRFIHLLKPQKRLLGNIFLLSLLITLLGIVTSFYFKIIMDTILPNGMKETLTTVSLLFLGLYIVHLVLSFFRGHLLNYLSIRLDVPLILGYYDHVVDLPMEFHNTRSVGEIISRFQDAGEIKSVISEAALSLMLDTLLIFFGGIILYLISPTLLVIVLIEIVLYLILTVIFFKPFKNKNKKLMEKNSEVTSYLVETLQGAETIKSLNYQTASKEKTESKYIDALNTSYELGKLSNIHGTLKSAVDMIAGLFIIWIGVYLTLDGKITIGELLTFNSLLAFFISPLKNVINLQTSIQTALVSSSRLTEIIDLDIEQTDVDSKLSNFIIDGNINIKDLQFRYGARDIVIDNINLSVEKGSSIAIVGETGCGKSTLIKLLMGYYKPTGGEVKFDNYNILDLNLDVLRAQIGYIPQDIVLFSGTVLDNLKMFNPDVPNEYIMQMCVNFGIDEFINSLPNRYNTHVDEKGSNLSGGQRQRIAIARALMKQPKILILDEATSNLDAIHEKQVMKLLDSAIETTKIIIAHRLSTVLAADKIVVMDKGKIVEIGNYDELIVKKGKFYTLWQSQRGDK